MRESSPGAAACQAHLLLPLLLSAQHMCQAHLHRPKATSGSSRLAQSGPEALVTAPGLCLHGPQGAGSVMGPQTDPAGGARGLVTGPREPASEPAYGLRPREPASESAYGLRPRLKPVQ